MSTFLGNIRALNAAGANPPVAGTFVVYDLPDRDCAALASNGQYTIANNGVANYFAYIDAILAVLQTYSDVKVILIIGKRSLLPPSKTLSFSNNTYRARLPRQSRHEPQRP